MGGTGLVSLGHVSRDRLALTPRHPIPPRKPRSMYPRTEPPGGVRTSASSEAPAQVRGLAGVWRDLVPKSHSSNHVSLGDPAPSPLPRFCPVMCSPVPREGGVRRAAKRGAEWWKGDADPSSYRIVEEIRLVQIPQVQEAGSREQPVGREGLQDGVHRGRLRRPPSPGLPSLQGGSAPGPELLSERRLAGGGRSGAKPRGGAGRGGAAPGRGRRGRGGLRAAARSRLGSGAPGAPRAFSRLLLLRLLPGHSWLPWGAWDWD